MREYQAGICGSYEYRMIEKTNQQLMNNFHKCCSWVAENCPNLNITIKCKGDNDKWLKFIVENGKAFLECGPWGWGFDIALSNTETATFVRGSMQRRPQSFNNVFFFHNHLLVNFLQEWSTIKNTLIEQEQKQTLIFSDDFQP